MKNRFKVNDIVSVNFSMTVQDEEGMPAVVGKVDGYTIIVYHENIADSSALKKTIINIIGCPIKVKVIEISEEDKIIIGNIKDVIMEERQRIVDDLVSGKRIKAKILKLLSYGAYVEYNGVGGFIKNVDFSDTYVAIEDVLKVGDEIEVELLRLSQTGKISFKAANKYVAERADIENFAVSDIRVGKVVSTRPFGTFVRLGVDLDCICPPLKSIIVEEGDKVVVQITEVLKDERRIRALIKKILR